MTESTTKPTKLEALNTRIEKLTTELAKLTTERDNFAANEAAERIRADNRKQIEVDGLPQFTKVVFFFGRKENRKQYSGEVVAFRGASDTLPAAYKIETGVGFDLEVKVVPARDVELAPSLVLADEA